MNRWIGLIVASLMVASGYFLLQQNGTKVSSKKEGVAQTTKPKKIDNIEILYIDDKKNSGDGQKNQISQVGGRQDSSSYPVSNPANQISNFTDETLSTDTFLEDKNQIKEFITQEGLQKVIPQNQNSAKKHQKFTVYAKNSYDQIDEQMYENKPPMIPTIVTATTPKGEKLSVVVDSKIVQNNDKIYIAKNGTDGNAQELVKVSLTQDTTSKEEDDTEQQSTQNQDKVKLILPPSFSSPN